MQTTTTTSTSAAGFRFEVWPGYAWLYRAYDTDGGYYATNNEGEGLFRIQAGDVRQLRGNGQFRARSLAEFRRKLTRAGV